MVIYITHMYFSCLGFTKHCKPESFMNPGQVSAFNFWNMSCPQFSPLFHSRHLIIWPFHATCHISAVLLYMFLCLSGPHSKYFFFFYQISLLVHPFSQEGVYTKDNGQIINRNITLACMKNTGNQTTTSEAIWSRTVKTQLVTAKFPIFLSGFQLRANQRRLNMLLKAFTFNGWLS